MSYNIEDIEKYIQSNDTVAIKAIMKDYGLEIRDGRLFAKDKNYAKEQEQFWDQRQYVIKILLNSLYGTLLNKHCKFFHHDVGQSTTLSGRRVAYHMNSYINKIITGVYDYKGDAIIYSDTDSTSKDAIIKYSENDVEYECTIEEFFDRCEYSWEIGDKEYKGDTNKKTLTYNLETDTAEYVSFNYVYRHKTNKEKWEITSEDGKSITVTNDHSCMVERDGILIEVKPYEILITDVLLVIE